MFRSLDELGMNDRAELIRTIADKKAGVNDQDWAEICEQYQLDISPDTLRKAGVGVQLVADAGMLREADNSNLVAISNGFIDRHKMRDLRKGVNDIFRSEARSELLREAVRDAIKELPPIEIDRPYATGGIRDRSLVVAMGDFHYGADICVTGLYGEKLNEYNSEVFELRMGKLLTEIAAILEKESIDTVHVLLVGDLLDGMLRQSQLTRLEYGIVESTMRLSEYIAKWLAELSAEAYVHVWAATGNHSEIRPLKSKSREFEDENLEKVIMWYLEARLADISGVEIHTKCDRLVMANIEGFDFLLLHGDGEKEIDDIAKETINCYQKKIDFFVCGHLHREEEFRNGTTANGESVVIRVPSLCGVDKYANSRRYNGKAGATAMIIERDYGRRCVYPIQLQ